MYTVWLTGLSGAGKSTLAIALAKRFRGSTQSVVVLDGDTVRHGICRDLGFSDSDRSENIRRVAEMCKLLNDQELAVIVALISPRVTDREMARQIIGPTRFMEVFLSTPLEVCEARDVKGIYRMARAGKIRQFTGLDSPYEAPLDPALKLDTSYISVEEGVGQVIALFEREP
jgi:adenylylsulfate kinase